MNKPLLFIAFLTLFACGKQTKEPKDNTQEKEQKPKEIVAVPIQKHATIPLDTAFARKLSKKETSSIFTRRRENQLGISNDIYQAYSYKDESGEYYILLTDHKKTITEEKDTLYDMIYGVNARRVGGQFKKRSKITDEIDNDWETSIGFWNQYAQITDIDNDGLVDPIIVYGTEGQNGYKDGRVRIIAYHMKKRVSIKHQNSEIPDGRQTKIGMSFYNFPPPIQKVVIEKMKLLSQNGHAVFSKDWEKKMAKKATRLEEM